MTSREDETVDDLDAGQVSVRWRLAGLLHRMPEFRGRSRISGWLIAGQPKPAGVHCGRFGPNLRFRARYREDGALIEFFFLQYEPPALAPVLEASLEPGGTFLDVGANIGVYSAWASRLVGETGQVHAFEPVPETRRYLGDIVALNGLRNVRIVPMAVGDQPGEIGLWVQPGASGNTSARPPTPNSERISVPTTTLDAYLAQDACPVPSLVKIDIEGFELDALRGATDLLKHTACPAVVFETWLHESTGNSFAEIVELLRRAGYSLFGLMPSGLRPIDGSVPLSLNTLALHPQRHDALARRLRKTRFRRNQNC